MRVCLCACVLGLAPSEGGVLGCDVALDAGGRLEGHRAAGALMEHVTVSHLYVRLDRDQTPEHHLAAGTPAEVKGHGDRT